MAKKYFRCDYSKYPSEPCEGVCIPLTKGYHAVIDSADFPLVRAFRWRLLGNPSKGLYASTGRSSNHVIMHHAIYGTKTKIDHLNGNGLDNRSANLRPCSVSQNGANRGMNKNNKSGFKGVYAYGGYGKWAASVRVNGRCKTKFGFPSPEAAAKAYDEMAVEYFGKYARINHHPQ